MKKLHFFNKLIFLINNVVAILLLLSFFAPHINPSKFSLAAILGLLSPALILINALFLMYWIVIGFRRQGLLSALMLLLSYFFLSPVYKFSSSTAPKTADQLSIMSYNVRKFNLYQWIKDDSIAPKISQFITEVDPDVVALQEFKDHPNFNLKYPYKSNPLVGNYDDPEINQKFRTPLAIYSKYPIIKDTIIKYDLKVMATYADIVKGADTIRIFNFHLESLGISPDKEFLGHQDSKSLFKRLDWSMKWQEVQINQIVEKLQDQHYRTIIACDMNNTAYSWIYKKTKKNFQDTFLEAGSGFGKTYDLKGFPLRIDYILVDQKLNVDHYQNFDVKFSDHYPILTRVSF